MAPAKVPLINFLAGGDAFFVGAGLAEVLAGCGVLFFGVADGLALAVADGVEL